MADVFVLSLGEPFEGYSVLSVHASVPGAANAAAQHAERELEFVASPTIADEWSSDRTDFDEYVIRKVTVQP